MKYIKRFNDFINEVSFFDLVSNSNLNYNNEFDIQLPTDIGVYEIVWNHNGSHDMIKRIKERTSFIKNEHFLEYLKEIFTFVKNTVDINLTYHYGLVDYERNISFIFRYQYPHRIFMITILPTTNPTDIDEKIIYNQMNEYINVIKMNRPIEETMRDTYIDWLNFELTYVDGLWKMKTDYYKNINNNFTEVIDKTLDYLNSITYDECMKLSTEGLYEIFKDSLIY